MTKEEHLKEAIALSELIARQPQEAKRYIARAILLNLKAYLKQPKQ